MSDMMDSIEFEESYVEPEFETTTFYYIGPKSLLGDKYPEAEHATISVEVPTNQVEARNAYVQISPTKDGSDYDWEAWDLDYADIEKLINMAKEAKHD